MKNLTQCKFLFIFLAVFAFMDIAYGQCDEPSPEKGTCSSNLIKWTYNAFYNYCSYFVYGGCGATENMFDTRGECYSACVRKSG